jgi:hypothetical protein
VAAPNAFWKDGTGDEIPERDRHYFWDKIDHQWVGDEEVSVSRLKAHINEVMKNPPSLAYMWSMSATAYNIWEGAVDIVETLASWYPAGGEWQLKSNIINFDWCTRSNSIMIKQCIESNSTKPVRYPSVPLITVPADGDVLGTFRPTISGEGTPGATVRFLQTGVGGDYGSAEVGTDGKWTDSFKVDVPHSPFSLTCDQILNGLQSGYSLPVTFTLSFPAPILCTPAIGEKLQLIRPTVSGEGVPGATVRFFQKGVGITLFGTAQVDAGGGWTGSFTSGVPQSPFPLTCDQTLNGIQSKYSPPLILTLRVARSCYLYVKQEGTGGTSQPNSKEKK